MHKVAQVVQQERWVLALAPVVPALKTRLAPVAGA
jgi:hypothetical protein